MNLEIEKAIKEIQDEIKEKEDYLDLLFALDWQKPVTEKQWHTICETPLRNSPLLGTMVKNIFPEAEDAKVSSNYVFFTLYGFTCAIPTSLIEGIEVRTDWYEKDRGVPKKENMHYGVNARMKNYFDALDANESWDVLLKYRVPSASRYRKWVRFFIWFCKYKWKDPHRKEWEAEFQKDEEKYNESLRRYYETRKAMNEKSLKMKNKLLPNLYCFTKKVRKYRSNSMGTYEIDEILKAEGL